jgi:UDP-N-acetylglucosamine:LPS N-acetylglucosamine transferase
LSPRILILTASVGEGHDLPARTLAAQIRSERPDVEVITEDALEPMGRLVTAISADAPRLVFFRFQWLWDVGYWIFAGFGPTRRGTQALLTRLGGRGLARLIDRVDPDVIACTYPNTTEVLGRLRRSGRIRVPVCAAITDLAAMHYWASPGVDVHLITHPESVAEVREVAGAQTRVQCVHGLTAPEFLDPHDQRATRTSLGLPLDGKIVLVSGGGWGVGDVQGAIEDALAVDEVVQVVCLCGRNEELRDRLHTRFANDARVRVEGFTDRMADWMAAADVLVHSTGGLTVLESLMLGLPAISYGWGRGHVRVNNAAFRRFGLATVAGSRAELAPALRNALAGGRLPVDGFRGLPSAASVVLGAVNGRSAVTDRAVS